MKTKLPEWAGELIALYESGSFNQFLFYGNVSDRMLVPKPGGEGAEMGSLKDYLLRVLLVPFDVILSYDAGNGIRVEKGGETFSDWPRIKQDPSLPKSPRAAIETLTHYFRYAANLARLGKDAPRVGLIVEAAELIAPPLDGGFNSDLNALVLLMREWANDTLIGGHAIATLLITENLNDIHPLISRNIRTGRIKIPLPDADALGAALGRLSPEFGSALGDYAGDLPGLAVQLVGASVHSIEQLMRTIAYKKERLDASGLVKLKRQMVEGDHDGLIGFVESARTLDAIHGQEKVKEWLRQDIKLWAAGDLRAMPMGYLLCGPVGTGKTYFVDCLAGEAGVPVVKLKNFRDKWVGSTEGNLEKIFRLLHALGRCIVFVDEADQALGKRDSGGGDSNVSGRVYSMLAEEMSDTDNRGKILWVLASSRPDLIEVDLKRPGRIDVRIPLFPTLTPEEGWHLLKALCKRTGLDLMDDFFALNQKMIPDMLTPGAAEALSVKTYRISKTQDLSAADALRQCLENYQLPVPRDTLMFQIDLALREASDLEFVPAALRSRIGH